MEIKKRINAIILNAKPIMVNEFVNDFCKDEKPESIKIGTESEFVDWLTDWIIVAPAKTKFAFLAMLDHLDKYHLRICSVCGEFMTEGYITANFDRYCSDECRLADYKKLCNGSDEEAKKLIERDFCEDSEDFYYNEW